MLWNRHPADHELLLPSDGARWPRTRAVKHIVGCPQCQRRQDVLTRAIDEFATAFDDRELPLPPSGPARARLQTRLAELSATPSPAALLAFSGQLRWLHAIALAAVVVGTIVLARGGTGAPGRRTEAPRVFLLPIPELTPGALRAVSPSELCGEKPDRPAPIPASVHDDVFRRYGADLRRAADYELDYLITPELGGVADARNLWPQAYTHTPWNAFVKDELERSLHRDVCDGTIALAAAQQQMADDWISAYKRRFNTDQPLRDYEANPLTAADRELLLSELEEMGVAPPAVHADGSGLLALFQATRRGWISDGPW